MAPKKILRPIGNVHIAAQPKPRRVTINILPEENRGMVHTGARLSEMAKHRPRVATSPEAVDPLSSWNTNGEKLDIWPALPIVVEQYDEDWQPKWGAANVAAALEQNNRIFHIGLCGVPTSQMEEILEAMHRPFPVLTGLWLESDDETAAHRPPPPPTRTLLPALTQLQFGGVSEYLEDLVVRIDTPLLDHLTISLFHRFIPDTPNLPSSSIVTKAQAHNEACVEFRDLDFHLSLGGV
ncbi:hypothetical protein BGY98DRAFT_1101082 [Russula aff. rugulosa BPL654]|nr:hypothetical protein BGY98DRAFT_1101082 [Russula aff. rugulosa BPL654]